MVEQDQVSEEEQQQADQPKQVAVTVVSIEDVGTLKKKVNVEIPRDQINGKLDENFVELAGTAQVPGFRIGRAPRRLIEKRFGKDVREQVRLTLIGAGVERAIEQEDLKTLGDPDLDLDKIQMPDDGPLAFSFEVEVEPEFDLPELDGIEVIERPRDVTDKDIDEQIENMRWRLAVLEEQNDDVIAEKGDQVHCDLTLDVGDQPPVVQNDIDLNIRAQAIEGITFDHLEDILVGAAVGDTKQTEATVSDEHANEAWRGQKARLGITVKKIARWRLPELNDEFARGVGFDTVQQYRDGVKTELEAQKGQQVRRDMEDQIRKYLVANTKFDLPEAMTNRQADRVLIRQVMQLRRMGMPEVLIEERLDELRTGSRDVAVEDLRVMFITGKIARLQEIEVSDEEVNSIIANMAVNQGRRPERLRQEMNRDGSYDNLTGMVREGKVLEKLLENAKITTAPAEPADRKPKNGK